jgi:hypothetical protein
MNDAEFIISGKVEGAAKVSKMLGHAPESFRRAIVSWMWRERNLFLGSNKTKGRQDGAFRKKLQKKISNRGIPWDPRVTRVFRGRMEGEKTVGTIKMIMGAGTQGEADSKFVQGLRVLGSGGKITSSNFMIVPIYDNFTGTKAEPHNQFKGMMARSELVYIRTGGHVFYLDKKRVEYGLDFEESLMFMGVKSIKVPKQFDFEGDWSARLPAVTNRGKAMIDKTTERVEKKYG